MCVVVSVFGQSIISNFLCLAFILGQFENVLAPFLIEEVFSSSQIGVRVSGTQNADNHMNIL